MDKSTNELEAQKDEVLDPIKPVTQSSDPADDGQIINNQPTLNLPEYRTYGIHIAQQLIGQRDDKTFLISKHYLDDKKYGLEGSNGTFFSNYYRHTKNNHELISLCFASKLNPFPRLRRFLVWINKVTLALLVATIISIFTTNEERMSLSDNYEYLKVEGIIVQGFSVAFLLSLAIGAYGNLLTNIAVCSCLYRLNICLHVANAWGTFFGLILLIAAAIQIAIVIFLNQAYTRSDQSFVVSFVGSIVLDYFSYFYFGIVSWMLVSWEGCLCLPIFCNCWGMDWPPRFLPILGLYPMKLMLRLLNQGDTYHDDKVEFKRMYPRSVAIDRIVDEEAQLEQGVSLKPVQE